MSLIDRSCCYGLKLSTSQGKLNKSLISHLELCLISIGNDIGKSKIWIDW
nr:MAG TPA: hypothetical protein [Caudoviricetes sp.]